MRKNFAGRISINPAFPLYSRKKERTFTPAEVRLVFGELGEP